MYLEISTENIFLYRLYLEHGLKHQDDSGFDVFMPNDETFKPGEVKCIPLDLHCYATRPEEPGSRRYVPCSFWVVPRSSIADTPLRLVSAPSLIDAGYRGTIHAPLENTGAVDYVLEKGLRILQIAAPDLSPIHHKVVTQLPPGTRGNKGFGSTGR